MTVSSVSLRGLGLMLAVAASLTACKEKAPPPAAKTKVGIVIIRAQPVVLMTELPGRTAAYRIAEVRPQVNGLIQKRLFKEGQDIKADQQLYQIDPAPYQASLASAQASVARASAGAESSRATLDRYRPLADAQAISRQDLDTAIATLRQSEADVASGQASVTAAAINLAFTRVTSPISGRAGRSSVTEGALVTASQATSLLTVTQLDPIYVDVTQPSATMLRLKRELASGQIVGGGKDTVPVKLVLEDGSDYEQPGTMQFSEVLVDQNTGSVTVRAIFPNEKGLLLPGMFVREAIEEGVRQNGLLVPQRGVSHDQKGQAVALVVGKDDKVEQRVLTTDRAVGDDWLVLTGIADGDRVIVDGLQKVKPGAEVSVEEVAPALNPPKPATPPAPPEAKH